MVQARGGGTKRLDSTKRLGGVVLWDVGFTIVLGSDLYPELNMLCRGEVDERNIPRFVSDVGFQLIYLRV